MTAPTSIGRRQNRFTVDGPRKSLKIKVHRQTQKGLVD